MMLQTKSYYKTKGVVLYKDDCVKVMQELPTDSIDCIFADPPYNLSNGGVTCQNGRMTSVDKANWDKSPGLSENVNFALTWIKECKRVLKPGGSLWVSGTHHNIFIVGYTMQILGLHILNEVVQVKKNAPPSLACKCFTHKHESVIWSVKEGAKHVFNYKDMKDGDFSYDEFKNPGKQMTDIWFINTTPQSEKKFGLHPTQKPLKLLERIILSTSKPGDVILDPFCGSGTTGVVARMHDRNFIGIDTDEADLALNKSEGEYLDLTIRRIEALNKL